MRKSIPPALPAFRETARTQSRAWDVLRQLTDEVGPRFSGTPGERAGIAWALAAMERAGLSNVRKEQATSTLWARGEERCELLFPRHEPLVVSALGGSIGTSDAGVEAEVVEVASIDEIDRLGRAKLEGRIVYVHHVMPRLRDGTGYNQGGWTRVAAASRAARHGAVGCLVRSIATHTNRIAHAGMLQYDGDAPKIPAAAICPPDGDLLHRLIASGEPVRVRLALGCRPLPPGVTWNVIGEVPGTDLAHEIVLLGAHLDTWDVGRGAVDDGAGCAIALEVARMLAAHSARPRRTLRIALFANEELGSGGGNAYAEAHRAEASKHFAAVEADQGDGRPWALRVPEGRRDTPAAKRLADALSPLGIELDGGPARGGVDILPLGPLGVPFVDLRQDASRYFDVHHSSNDVLEHVSREELDAAVAGFAVAIAVLASMPESLRG